MRNILSIALTLLVTAWLALGLSDARAELEGLKEGRQVLMIRHADAPGSGDPADFSLDDCARQRNLGAEGRAHARRIGDYLRAAGIEQARVLSSEWCRCRETAELLGLGPVETFTGLNSFYTVPEKREEWLTELRNFFDLIGRKTDEPLILVTHFVTISAIAGVSVASGEGVLLDLHGFGDPPALADRLKIQ